MNKEISFNDLEILFEDKDIVVINKPEGLASIHDSAGSKTDLQTILSNHYKNKILVVHRLDKEVSGVILYAKNEATHKQLNKQFAERTVKKTYSAIVHGKVDREDGVINYPIREFGSGRMGVDTKKGKLSKTYYSVKERFGDFTLLELNPTTGRRHQLRVHLYAINHSIVGDVRYGEKDLQEKFPRLMLHAKSICFTSREKKEINIFATPPNSFTDFVNKLKTNFTD